ncbi:hypothetical protein LOTGIDRAFT_232173 [Lottia gigantea]|uniref:Uncharacterized protein n=1 Tax=Lottia gigantea TaxID=225164 RepID=V4AN78_LOTGI|nr:hypothetical protein LOTGIDRAFT_232173 [Lottia gigantea]ESO95066.1 hypothetical protein LOTGIDRAFT_232173 [Lottia gigantea]
MSDSDTDSEDEIQIKKYFNNDLLSAIKQAKHAQESRSGIKRAPGHHLLRNKKQVVIVKRIKAYDGRHWNVDCDNSLERATKRLTINAVIAEEDKEQLRRVKEEENTSEQARKVLLDLHAEFFANMSLSKWRQAAEEAEETFDVQSQLSDVQCQLVRQANSKDIDNQTEEEKFRQLKLVTQMNNKATRTLSQEDLLIAMAESNRKKIIVQTDLVEAFARYEDEKSNVTQEYNTAMFEVMDESLNSIKQMFNKRKTRRESLVEQNRRVADLKPLMKERTYQRYMHHYNIVMSNLRNAFKKVRAREEEIEAESRRITEERKVIMQEQLVRKHAMKWVTFAFAKERQRQITECEEKAFKSDPFYDAVKLALAKVQREMILHKFNGKWVDKRKTSTEMPVEGLTEHDRMLKTMRMKSRRKSCVVKEDDD